MRSVVLDTRQKALAINLDKSIYGTFAEIGAGQEIARHFFIAGGASGTIAKSLSAYDMSMSDYLYGERPGRYVCKARLNQMLDKEFGILMETLALQKPDRRYFAIANTVEAINYDRSNKSHGWLGVKFQTEPGGEPNEVIVHLRLLDRENILQQEILGVLGVNLLYGCYFLISVIISSKKKPWPNLISWKPKKSITKSKLKKPKPSLPICKMILLPSKNLPVNVTS